MTAAIEQFFTAWCIEDDATRDAQVKNTIGAKVFYADPRTESALTDTDAIVAYVGQFSKMAPGMPVSVEDTSTTLEFTRATVRFGEGEQSQLGQYICELDDSGKLIRLIGFAGIGVSN